MTESLFFSQIATKSINAQKIAGASSSKMYRGDNSDFDKHLELNDRSENRGRDRDNVTDLRKEPKFTRETRDRDYSASERQEPSVRDDAPRKERTERADNTQDAKTGKPTDTQENTNSARNENDTTENTDHTSAQNSEENTESANLSETSNKQITTDTEIALAAETDTEEVSLETLVSLTDEDLELNLEDTPTDNNEEKALEAAETGQVVPLFGQETANETSESKAENPQALASAQHAQINTDTDIASEEAAQIAIKQPRQTAQTKLEGHIDAKTTSQAAKPGLETALAKLQETKPIENGRLEVAEVKNASKNASFLGEVNIEQAQKADKTDIKARIGDLAQKAASGPVATSTQVKPNVNTLQLGASRIDATAQLQPVTGETTMANSPNLHSVHVRFGSLPQATQTAQIPVTTMAFHIAKSVENGVNRFEIRIDPPELGRVDVKLEVNQAGRVIANLTVERPETLDLLQRDQRALERALQDAGLDVGGESLNFSLKDQSANNSEDNSFGANNISDSVSAEEELIEPEMITGYISNTGVDIRI